MLGTHATLISRPQGGFSSSKNNINSVMNNNGSNLNNAIIQSSTSKNITNPTIPLIPFDPSVVLPVAHLHAVIQQTSVQLQQIQQRQQFYTQTPPQYLPFYPMMGELSPAFLSSLQSGQLAPFRVANPETFLVSNFSVNCTPSHPVRRAIAPSSDLHNGSAGETVEKENRASASSQTCVSASNCSSTSIAGGSTAASNSARGNIGRLGLNVPSARQATPTGAATTTTTKRRNAPTLREKKPPPKRRLVHDVFSVKLGPIPVMDIKKMTPPQLAQLASKLFVSPPINPPVKN